MAAARPTMQKQESSLGVTEKNIKEMQMGKKDEDADLLAEDDEFEEFDAETWDKADEDHEDQALWGDNWDDDDVGDDDFSKQLRAELAKPKPAAPAAAAAGAADMKDG